LNINIAKKDKKITKVKFDTSWYDDLALLYQKTRDLGITYASTELRNLGWNQIQGIVYNRVHTYIRKRKSLVLSDKDLVQKLFQESFFIFVKALNIWDRNRKTKFLTFLGDILNQEIMNIVRLDRYHKTRDYKIEKRIQNQKIDEPIRFFDEECIEKESVLEEVKVILNSIVFETQLERDLVNTIIFGDAKDLSKLRKSSKMSVLTFLSFKDKIKERLKQEILSKSSEKTKSIIKEIVELE